MKICVSRDKELRKYGLRKPVFCRAVVLFVLILLAAVTCANASVTVAVDGGICSFGRAAFSQTPYVLKTFESTDSRLIVIGKEITKPYIASAISSAGQHNDVAFLPAAPAAVVMALVGLVCVLLVRGRSVWAAALIYVLSAGQAGFQIVPRLARLCVQTHSNRNLMKSPKLYLFGNSIRARCDIEGSRYIGLVKYLTGIPNNIPFFYDAVGTFAKTEGQLQSHQCLITTISFYPVSAVSRTVSISGGNIHFKSVFTAQIFSRGPPGLTSLQ